MAVVIIVLIANSSSRSILMVRIHRGHVLNGLQSSQLNVVNMKVFQRLVVKLVNYAPEKNLLFDVHESHGV